MLACKLQGKKPKTKCMYTADTKMFHGNLSYEKSSQFYHHRCF